MGMIIQNGKLFSGEPKTTYTERVLWSGSQTVTTSGVDIALSDNLSEYDEVIFEYHDSSFNAISNFLVNGLTIGDSYIQEAYRPNSLGVWFTYTNDTTLNVKAISSNITHTKITGIKYGDTVKRKDYHVYSTEEKIVGEWIDGSTLYEKTLEIASISADGDNLIPHGITGLANLIGYSGYCTYAGEDQLNIPYLAGSSFITINTWNSTNLVFRKSNLSYSATNVKVTIRYTKSST